jgi:hypothetical protein
VTPVAVEYDPDVLGQTRSIEIGEQTALVDAI